MAVPYRFISKVLMVLLAATSLLMIYLAVDSSCDCSVVDDMARKLRSMKLRVLDLERQLADKNKDCGGPQGNNVDDAKTKLPGDVVEEGDNPAWGPHKLAVLVPYRDRFEELMEFLPYMHKYLNMQHIRHQIIIVNQIDSHRFNRASLLNIGFLHSKEDCDYVVMHDVDLLPKNPKISYAFDLVEGAVHHIASPELHPRYHYETFVGGILMVKSETFQKLNGLSNKFWGWGREDDEFYLRMKDQGIKVTRPENIDTGYYDTFYHIHDKDKRKRDFTRIGIQQKEQFKRDRITGLDTVEYELRSSQKLSVEGATCTMLHVELDCDKTLSPWCDPPAVVKPQYVKKQ